MTCEEGNKRMILRSESMATVDDIKRIIAYKKARLEALSQLDMWLRYTKNMECGEEREFKQSCIDDEIIIEALEKQIPKEVKEWSTLSKAKCPHCKNLIEAHAGKIFCCYCGQALDWSDTE